MTLCEFKRYNETEVAYSHVPRWSFPLCSGSLVFFLRCFTFRPQVSSHRKTVQKGMLCRMDCFRYIEALVLHQLERFPRHINLHASRGALVGWHIDIDGVEDDFSPVHVLNSVRTQK